MTPSTATFLRRCLKAGLIAGLVMFLIGAVGMLDEFAGRNVITGFVSLGTLALVAVVFVAAYRTTRPEELRGEPRTRPAVLLLAGVVTGVAAGAALGLLVLGADTFDPRAVLQNVTPRMLRLLTLNLPTFPGALVLPIVGGVVGLLAAALHLLPRIPRTAVVSALLTVLLVSLMEPFLRVMLVQLRLDAAAGWLYQRGGLSPVAAVVLLVAVGVAAAAWAHQGPRVRGRIDALPHRERRTVNVVGAVVLILFLVVLPQLVGSFLSEVLGTVGLFVLLGLGLNIVVGFAGLLDLGYVAFYAVGAYSTAVLTSTALHIGLDFWASLPFVILIGAIAGLLIGAPVLRLRGDYLAIVTLGFGEIARILFLSDALKPYLGGAQGILGIPAPRFVGFNLREPQTLYYLILAFCVIAALVAWSLANSRVGRAWNAMREDEQVAEATGINTTNYKLLAFAIGAVFGCLAGALFAVKIGSVFAQSFPLLVSITALALIILGGMGNIAGVIVGALVLVGLPEILREFAEFRLLIYGVVLVAMMIMRPEGLIPSATRRRELHEEDEPEDQFERRADNLSPAPVVTTGAGS